MKRRSRSRRRFLISRHFRCVRRRHRLWRAVDLASLHRVLVADEGLGVELEGLAHELGDPVIDISLGAVGVDM